MSRAVDWPYGRAWSANVIPTCQDEDGMKGHGYFPRCLMDLVAEEGIHAAGNGVLSHAHLKLMSLNHRYHPCAHIAGYLMVYHGVVVVSLPLAALEGSASQLNSVRHTRVDH